MSKKHLLLSLALLVMFAGQAAGIIIPENVLTITNGIDYYETGGYDTFVYIDPGSPNNIVAGFSDGSYQTLYYGNNSGQNPLTVWVDVNGQIWYSCEQGIIKITRDAPLGSPQDLGTLTQKVFVSLDTTRAFGEDSQYVYYYDHVGGAYKAIDKQTLIVSTAQSFNGISTGPSSTKNHVAAFTVIDGQFYSVAMETVSTNSRASLFNNTQRIAYLSNNVVARGNSVIRGFIEPTEVGTLYVKGGIHTDIAYHSLGIRELYLNGTVKKDYLTVPGVSTTGQAWEKHYKDGFLGVNNPTIYYKDGVNINMLAVDYRAPRLTSLPLLPMSDLDIDGSVTTGQDSYYNNSVLDARLFMKVSGTQNYLFGSDEIIDDNEFELLLYSPEGVIIGRYTVPSGLWEHDRDWSGINFVPVATVSRQVQFQPPADNWDAGLYIFRLTETGQDGVTGLISDKSIHILNETGYVGGGTVAPEDLTSEDVFSSTAFKALMFITLPALGLGIVAGLPGTLVGLVIGIFLAFAIGLIPLAYLILIIFAIVAAFAAFARDMITGNKGG